VGNEYEATVPLDKFEKADAQWIPFSIMFIMRLKGDAPFKIESQTDLSASSWAQALVYFPHPEFNGGPNVRVWEHGPTPPTLTLFCKSYKDRSGKDNLTWWEAQISGYNHNRFIITTDERSIRINLVDRSEPSNP
jgi:hypothetical protein